MSDRYPERNTFENLDAHEPAELATYDLEGTPATSGPLVALGWLTFVVALLCSPVIVWAVWGALR